MKTTQIPFLVHLLIVAALLLSAASASAAPAVRQDREKLTQTYLENRDRLETSGFGLPLYLDSFERGEKVHVDVYGVFDSTFSNVVSVLKVPAHWCDIVSLHPNVKACTWGRQTGDGLLTFYVGRKGYQPPEDAQQILYRYRAVSQEKGYQDIMLTAETGPFGTKDHSMRFEALPLSGGRTFVHVSYQYSDSAALRLAEKAYFATLGRGKVGFTVTGTDSNDQPVYIRGPRGAIERNAVRYYFAIQSFMNTMRYPESSMFNVRISQWYDLTSRFPKQLSDLNRPDYLTFKTKEHTNQLKLQGLITQ